MQWFDYLLLVISLFLIMIIVLQTSKENASSSFSGEKSMLQQLPVGMQHNSMVQ